MESLVDSFIDHLTVERGLAENTRLAYRSDLAQFLDYLRRHEIRHVNALRRQDINDHLLDNSRGNAAILIG